MVSTLEDLYLTEGYDHLLNHADFWALVSILGVEEGIKLACSEENSKCAKASANSGLCFDYYWGRNECGTAPLSEDLDSFPDPAMTLEEMFHYYHEEFGFNSKEVSNIISFKTRLNVQFTVI